MYLLSGDELLDDDDDIVDRALLTTADVGVILLDSLDGSRTGVDCFWALSLIRGGFGGLSQS